MPALAVAASLDSRGEGVSEGGSRMCLRAEISTSPCMVRSDVIEEGNNSCDNGVVKKGKKGEFLPVLAVAASLDSGEEGVGGGGL